MQIEFEGTLLAEYKDLERILKGNDFFLITTHVHPDADAIGSEMAFYLLLKKLGKQAVIINHSETPKYLTFLDYESVIQTYNPEKHDKYFDEVDVLVALDFNQLNRTVSMEKKFSEAKGIKICLDHHQSPDDFVDYYFNGTHFAATGEVIYDFIKKTEIIDIEQDIALQLYTAIMTDTGSFRFERTNSDTHLIAADLLNKGISPIWVYDQIYNQNSLNKINLLGNTLHYVRTTEDGKIAYMIITRKMLEESGADESEVDGFINYCMAIEGVRIGLLFMEVRDGIKISYRSAGEIPVNKLAQEFEGGGHNNAAGSRLFNCEIEDYLSKVIEAAKKYLD